MRGRVGSRRRPARGAHATSDRPRALGLVSLLVRPHGGRRCAGSPPASADARRPRSSSSPAMSTTPTSRKPCSPVTRSRRSSIRPSARRSGTRWSRRSSWQQDRVPPRDRVGRLAARPLREVAQARDGLANGARSVLRERGRHARVAWPGGPSATRAHAAPRAPTRLRRGHAPDLTALAAGSDRHLGELRVRVGQHDLQLVRAPRGTGAPGKSSTRYQPPPPTDGAGLVVTRPTALHARPSGDP